MPEQSFRIDQQRSRSTEDLRDLTREYVEKLQTILAVEKPSVDLLRNLRQQIGAQVKPELQLEVQFLVMHAIRLSIVKDGQADSDSITPSN